MQRMRRARSLEEDDVVMPTERQRAGADIHRLTRAKFVFDSLSQSLSISPFLPLSVDAMVALRREHDKDSNQGI